LVIVVARATARIEVKCWLCGRRVEHHGEPNLLPRTDIPIHRECLEDRSDPAPDSPPNQPDDVVYF
jgi:hypothetical protein